MLNQYENSKQNLDADQSRDFRTSFDTKSSRQFTSTNQKQNVQKLLKGIHCRCGQQESFNYILRIMKQRHIRSRQEKNKYKQKCKQLKQQNDFLRKQKAQLQKQLFMQIQKSSKMELNILIPHQKTIQQKGLLYKQLQQLKHTRQKQVDNFDRWLKQKQKIIYEYSQKQSSIKAKNIENKLSKKGIANMQKKILELQQQNNQLLKLVHSYQDKIKYFKQNDSSSQKSKPTLDSSFSKNLLLESNCPKLLASQQQYQLWQLASRIGEQAWQRHLQLEIRHLCSKKQQLRQIQSSINIRQKKLCKCKQKKFDIIH